MRLMKNVTESFGEDGRACDSVQCKANPTIAGVASSVTSSF